MAKIENFCRGVWYNVKTFLEHAGPKPMHLQAGLRPPPLKKVPVYRQRRSLPAKLRLHSSGSCHLQHYRSQLQASPLPCHPFKTTEALLGIVPLSNDLQGIANVGMRCSHLNCCSLSRPSYCNQSDRGACAGSSQGRTMLAGTPRPDQPIFAQSYGNKYRTQKSLLFGETKCLCSHTLPAVGFCWASCENVHFVLLPLQACRI